MIPDVDVSKESKPARLELFPIKLHRIIERSEQNGYSSIISWQSHGRSFNIHDEKLFLEKLICQFFYMREIKSFIRQLVLYGFKRIVGEDHPERCCYYHEMFLRGRPGLCTGMTVQKTRALIDVENEPDFSQFSPMPLTKSISIQKESHIQRNVTAHLKLVSNANTDINFCGSVKPNYPVNYEKAISVASALLSLRTSYVG